MKQSSKYSTLAQTLANKLPELEDECCKFSTNSAERVQMLLATGAGERTEAEHRRNKEDEHGSEGRGGRVSKHIMGLNAEIECVLGWAFSLTEGPGWSLQSEQKKKDSLCRSLQLGEFGLKVQPS